MVIINDGTGTGRTAKVCADNRLSVESVNTEAGAEASQIGDAYNINTGTIALTTANESAVMYVKNNEDQDLVVTTIVFLLGNSTAGTGDLELAVFSNPTVGTVVSDASNVDMKHNKNFGSNKTLTADAFKGAEGKTLTDGTVAFRSLLAGGARVYLIATGDIILPKGSSIGIKITPQTSNSAMDVQVALATFLKNDE